jgi:peroxidase
LLQGCDGSVLLDDTETLVGEKKAEQNINSVKGFDLVDKIKEKLEAECPGAVTCADLLAIAARDAVVLVNNHQRR